MMVNFTYTCWKWQFFNKNISQGSVATRLRCGGMFNYHCAANLPLSMSVKKFWKSVKKWQRYSHEFGVSLFLEHGVEIQRKSATAQLSYFSMSSLEQCVWHTKLTAKYIIHIQAAASHKTHMYQPKMNTKTGTICHGTFESWNIICRQQNYSMVRSLWGRLVCALHIWQESYKNILR